MTQNKIYMELSFNRNISSSQRIKVKDFWKFLHTETHLQPYRVTSDKKFSGEEGTDKAPPVRTRKMWHDQLKIFQEHGLDEVALAADKKCKICSINANYRPLEFADMEEQPYEELLDDMKVFDERLNDKTSRNIEITEKESRS